MNTIRTYVGDPKPCNMRGYEITKEALEEKIHILIDVVQSLIEHIAEKEGVQLGVMAMAATTGLTYQLYMNPLIECASCKAKLPMLKQGEESPPVNEEKLFICWDCHYKSKRHVVEIPDPEFPGIVHGMNQSPVRCDVTDQKENPC